MELPVITKLELEDLEFGYGIEGQEENTPIKYLSYTLEAGNIYLLQGDNGSGKSTILKGLINNVPFPRGTVHVSLNVFEERRSIGIQQLEGYVKPAFYMPQRVQEIFPARTCVDTVLSFWATLGGKYQTKVQRQALYEQLELVPLINLTRWRHCEALSGGQAQFIALTLMFLRNSKFVLLDEPTASISEEKKAQVKKLITLYKSINSDVIILVATHDDVLKEIADDTIKLGNSAGGQR